jgi:pyruvate-formate lyase-activating enzyme
MVPGMLDAKGTKILAKSLFKELRGNGYTTKQILSLSTELIDLVTQDLKAVDVEAMAAAEGPAEPRAIV